jgi:hypothetical protein
MALSKVPIQEVAMTADQPEQRSWGRLVAPGFEDDVRIVFRIEAVMQDDGLWSTNASFPLPREGDPRPSRAEQIAIMREAVAQLAKMVDSTEAHHPQSDTP